MTKQRFRLGEQYGKSPRYYHATFTYLTHKVNSQKKKIAVILLKDVYLVDSQDKKKRLDSTNDFIDKKGRHIVADHLWVKLTKPWLKLSQELIAGDEIYFKANVKKYRINRSDVLEKREQIWQEAQRKNDLIYRRWSKYTDTHKRKNFDLSLAKMKAKQKTNIEQAKKDQQKLELVDYSLDHVSDIHVARLVKPKYHFQRTKYDYQQYRRQGYTYSAWLAVRSIKYQQGNVDPEFTNTP